MISVCLASYNGELYIREQLNSILSQLGVDDEIIISDDSSNDGTIKVIQSYDDPRIILLESMPGTKKLGVVKNFERAIRHASGDYIFLSDQDDIWLEGKVTSVIDALQNNLLVVTDCRVVDLHLQEINKSFFQLRRSGKGVIKNILKNSYLGCCMAFQKELLEVALPFPNKIAMHDIWLGCLADTLGQAYFIEQPFLLYRRHGKNASPTAERSTLSLCDKISYRLILVICLFFRLFTNRFWDKKI